MILPEQHDTPVPPGATWRTRARHNRRSLELTAFILVLFLIDFFWSSHTASTAAAGQARIQAQAIAAEQKAISAGCDFWYPLTTLPVIIPAGQKTPTKLSVKIIAGSRESYAGQCTGRAPLPPADPTLVKWARIYRIPLPDPP